VKIDLEGLSRRVVELPVDHGLYYGLDATAKKWGAELFGSNGKK